MNNQNIDNSMHVLLNELESELSRDEPKSKVLDECVSNRMKDVYLVQSKYLDDNLDRFISAASFSLHDIDKMKILCNVLKDLYKNLSVDRLKMLDTIMRICED